METMRAAYVDGRQARVHDVELMLGNDEVVITSELVSRRMPIGVVEITDAIGSAPRLMRFDDGACCEPMDPVAFERALEAAGVHRSRISNWERSPQWIAAGIATLAIIVTFTYHTGIPRMARVVVDRLPDAASEQIGRHTMSVLDRSVFERTELPASRQSGLVLAFDRLEQTVNGRRYEVQFRKAPGIGANALALPGGTIVVTDDLVKLAQDDREILGVLAHESGHVARRHGERQILEGSAVALFVTWFIGDANALAAAAPAAMLQAKYSRDLERDADEHAIFVLRQNGIPTHYLASILERLARTDRGSGEGSMLDYLSTHPATAERLARFRE
jgi:Zn-dependent protease with chaperone function